MALIYEAGIGYNANNVVLSTMCALPGAALAYYTFQFTYWFAYPMLFLPTFYYLKYYVDCYKNFSSYA